mmetsp:Transcript_30857/g.50976  ORF Transcript_30857/g.50976 Transcript_30857/m.50976 type:complete len:214 (-) Transcript_30857:138-779(-)
MQVMACLRTRASVLVVASQILLIMASRSSFFSMLEWVKSKLLLKAVTAASRTLSGRALERPSIMVVNKPSIVVDAISGTLSNSAMRSQVYPKQVKAATLISGACASVVTFDNMLGRNSGQASKGTSIAATSAAAAAALFRAASSGDFIASNRFCLTPCRVSCDCAFQASCFCTCMPSLFPCKTFFRYKPANCRAVKSFPSVATSAAMALTNSA